MQRHRAGKIESISVVVDRLLNGLNGRNDWTVMMVVRCLVFFETCVLLLFTRVVIIMVRVVIIMVTEIPVDMRSSRMPRPVLVPVRKTKTLAEQQQRDQ